MAAKYAYRNLIAFRVESKVNVLIYGNGTNGTMLKRAIEETSQYQYKVIGYVETDPRLIGKYVDGTRVFSLEQAHEQGLLDKVRLFFLADDNIDLKLKNEIADLCHARKVQVKVVPPTNQWIHGKLKFGQIQELKIEDLLNRPPIELPKKHVNAYLSTRRVLVTGAAGSIGSEIARQVASAGPVSLILCDQNETGLYELEYSLEQLLDGRVLDIVVCMADVRDKKAMHYIFQQYKPQVVFHAAAYKHVPLMEKHPSEAVRNNVLGTKVLADISVNNGVERFVLISTDKAINPTNVMGATKRVAEMYVQGVHFYQGQRAQNSQSTVVTEAGLAFLPALRTRFITTRFGNVLGSNGSVIPRFTEQIKKGGPVTVTHPDINRYFMTIPEACSLVLEAGTTANGGEIFVFDMGQPVKIYDMARKMIQLAGYTPDKDIAIEFSGLRPGEKLFEELQNSAEETMPTHHERILISKVKVPSDSIFDDVSELTEFADGNKEMEVVTALKKLIPEYKSRNSVYEILDRKDGQHAAVGA